MGHRRPWPLDLPADAWNPFVERHADTFYRPRVAPFIEHLRSIGALDIAPNLAPGTYETRQVLAVVLGITPSFAKTRGLE